MRVEAVATRRLIKARARNASRRKRDDRRRRRGAGGYSDGGGGHPLSICDRARSRFEESFGECGQQGAVESAPAIPHAGRAAAVSPPRGFQAFAKPEIALGARVGLERRFARRGAGGHAVRGRTARRVRGVARERDTACAHATECPSSAVEPAADRRSVSSAAILGRSTAARLL